MMIIMINLWNNFLMMNIIKNKKMMIIKSKIIQIILNKNLILKINQQIKNQNKKKKMD